VNFYYNLKPTINLKTIRAAIHVFPICVFYNLPRITVVLTSIERGKNMFRNGRTLFFLVKYPSELRLSCPSYVKIHQALSLFSQSNYNLFDVHLPSSYQLLTLFCSCMHIRILSCLNSDPQSGNAMYVPKCTYVRSGVKHMAT